MLSPVLVTPPAESPVSLGEAKAVLRVDHNDDDEKITSLILGRTALLDGYDGLLGRAIVTQTWSAPYENFTSLLLPLAPVQSITGIEYWNGTAMTAVAAPSGGFRLIKTALGWRVSNARGTSWPGATWHEDGAVFVTFVAGQEVADVPEDIKMLIKIGVKMDYDENYDLVPAWEFYLNKSRRYSL